MAESARDYW